MLGRVHPFDAHHHEAGFAAGADARIASSAKAGDRAEARRIRESQRGPRIHAVELDQRLPDDFVSEAVARLEIHVRRGHWSQAQETLACLEREWELLKALTGRARTVRLGSHVAELLLDARTINLIESVCCGTVGALLECFPLSLAGKPNCGPATVRKIAESLLRCGILSQEETQRRLDEYMQFTLEHPQKTDRIATVHELRYGH